ncbi:hypothetical protein KJ975_02165 [Myxococcota bacterium]|nr:hypothetical protein [Myxococcota bacterium]
MSESPWGLSITPPPVEAAELAAMVVDAVRHRFGVEMDLTSDTLPFLDQLAIEHRKAPGGVKQLFASAAGAYLGETLRRTFGGIWHLPDPKSDPIDWTVRFLSCPMAIRPIALGHEIFSHKAPEEPILIVAPKLVDALENALSAASPVGEEEYYSFSGRFDALHLVVDVLSEIERMAARQAKRPPKLYGPEDPANLI